MLPGRGRLVIVDYCWEDEPISRPLANDGHWRLTLDSAAPAAETIIDPADLGGGVLTIGGDTVDLYIDGTDSGELKIDLVDTGNFGHFSFWARATADIHPPGS